MHFQKAVARLQRGLGGRWSERKTAFRYRQWIAIFVELGLRRVYAQCFADNAASWRIMEKLGMRREEYAVRDSLHRSGQWMDGMRYAILSDEWRARPAGTGSA